MALVLAGGSSQGLSQLDLSFRLEFIIHWMEPLHPPLGYTGGPKMKLHTMGFHSLFPRGVVCVLHTREEVDAVLVKLTKVGFGADKTVVLSGQAGLNWLDPDGSQHGRFARFVRKLQKLCSEGEEELLKHVQDALVAGRHVLIVTTHGRPRERELVRSIVRDHTKETVFYCGTLAIEEFPVTTESGPEARSARA